MKKMILNFITILSIPLLMTNAFAESTNGAAKSGKTLQLIAAAANAYVGKIYVGECFAQKYVSCGLAVLSFAQAGMMLTSASQSSKTEAATKCTDSYCAGGTGQPPIDPTTGLPPIITDTGGTLPPDETIGRIQDDVNTELAKLATNGYTYDPATNTFNTPNGSVAGSSLSTSDGLKSAFGLSDADLKKFDELGKKGLKEASKIIGKGGGEFETAGGGGHLKGGPGYDIDNKNFDMNKYLAGLMNKDGKDHRGVAGLEKKYGSDQIGVAQDDIFKMIHRRYEANKPSLTH